MSESSARHRFRNEASRLVESGILREKWSDSPEVVEFVTAFMDTMTEEEKEQVVYSSLYRELRNLIMWRDR
ncbi:MAG: hypothetical protein ACREBU_09185 [Nitrososphaera sp.]